MISHILETLLYELTRDQYNEVEGNLHDWLESYVNDLTDEYGDPYRSDEEE